MKPSFALFTLALVALLHGRDAQAQYAQPRPLPYPPGPSDAPRPVPAPSYHQHDGFYLHTDLGIARASSTGTTQSDSDLALSGGGGAFAIALGGAVARNLIVFGELTAVAVAEPLAKVNGREVAASVRPQSFGVGGIGPGVSYYFDPSNFFLSASLLISTLTITDVDGVSLSTARGPGLALKVGKEWWVSQDWGLGILLGVYASSSKDKENEVFAPATWKNSSAFLSFSATYN